MSRQLNKKDPYLLDRLLSGSDALSPAERNLVYRRARVQAGLDDSGKQHRVLFGWAPVRWASVAVALAVGTAAVMFLLLRSDSGSQYASRGMGPHQARFSLACPDAPDPEVCRSGDKLIFVVTAAQERNFFASFARREDGAVIWYFPSTSQEPSIRVSSNRVGGVLQRGILLGPQHEPGRYQVTGIFSAKPLTQQQVKAALVANRTDQDNITVLSRDLTVQGSE